MKKRCFSFLAMLTLAVGMVQAQIYTYVEQNGEPIDKLGTAIFDTKNIPPTVEFVNGKAVMTIGQNIVASISMSNGGALVVDSYEGSTLVESGCNKISKSPSSAKPYVTVYSPFQLVVPDDCEVYAPEFNVATQTLRLTNGNRIQAREVVPAETPLVVKGTQPVDFYFSAARATCAPQGDLSGTALRIDTPADGAVYTFGRDKNNLSLYGLFRYVAATLPPGVAYLETTSASPAKYISMSSEDGEATGVQPSDSWQEKPSSVVKQIDNGRLVIKKGNKKYLLDGRATR